MNGLSINARGIFYDRNETSGAERLYVASSQGVQAFEMNGTLIQTLDSGENNQDPCHRCDTWC